MINKKKLLPSNGICIIQGALLNFGRDINHNKDGFNPVKVILKNVKILEKLNIYIIISTWEPTEIILNNLEKLSLKKLKLFRYQSTKDLICIIDINKPMAHQVYFII